MKIHITLKLWEIMIHMLIIVEYSEVENTENSAIFCRQFIFFDLFTANRSLLIRKKRFKEKHSNNE